MSIFTLPPEMIGFYKKNIEYMTEHAIDPDKRRYATKFEAPRHYIDIDKWDVIPFLNVPRDFEEAIIKYCDIQLLSSGDTILLTKDIANDSFRLSTAAYGGFDKAIDYATFVKYWKKVIRPMYYEEEWKLSAYDFDDVFSTNFFTKNNAEIVIEDHFSEHGIVPYHLESMLYKLTKAFENNDVAAVLRNSAEFGHYISDAHVPLHTTSNYNGQLTNQVGIHAFWESRVPELFAESEYDFFVGQAEYIEDPKEYFWNIIIKAHSHLDSVLLVEKRLSVEYDSDKQFCFDTRLNQTIRIQCPEYAAAYTKALGSMVEEQMQSSIRAVGSVLYTAWVNAGQPILDNMPEVVFKEEVIVPDQNIKVRAHDN